MHMIMDKKEDKIYILQSILTNTQITAGKLENHDHLAYEKKILLKSIRQNIDRAKTLLSEIID